MSRAFDCSTLIECPICCDYFKTVSETPCCHGLYCQSCLTEWNRSNGSCPSCRKKIELNACTTNVPIQRFVDSIPLECPYKLEGCNATPPRYIHHPPPNPPYTTVGQSWHVINSYANTDLKLLWFKKHRK